MNKSRKILSLVTAAMMISTTSCSLFSKKPNSGTETVTAAGHFAEKVKIEWKSTFSYTDQIDKLIADFQEIEPNVEVTYTKISGNYSALKTNVIDGIGAANIPNIVTCYPDHVAEYLDYGIVLNLEKYMDAEDANGEKLDYAWTDEDYEDVLPSLMSQCNSFAAKGTYMLPHTSSTEAMFYNEEILGKTFEGCNNGNPITARYLNDITWEELMGNLAPAIYKYNADHGNCWLNVGEGGKGAVVAYSGSDNAFVTLTEQQGVTFSAINKSTGNGEIHFNDDRTMKNVMKQFHGYYQDDLFTTAALESETNLNVNEKLYAVFATGSTGGIKYQVPSDASFNTGVMRIPNFKGKPHKVISQGPGLCALKVGSDAQKLASYLFMNFMIQKENTLYWALETGYFPVRSSCFEDDLYIEATSTKGKTEASTDLLKAKVYTYASTVQQDFFTNVPFKGSDSARSLAGSLLDECVGYEGEITDSVLDEKFAAAVNEILKKM